LAIAPIQARDSAGVPKILGSPSSFTITNLQSPFQYGFQYDAS
jgi:hypothetical protein